MKYGELVDRVAERSGRPKAHVRDVLSSLTSVAIEALGDGDEVPLRGLCVIGSRWQDPRPVRSIKSRRRVMLDGRFVVRYRTSKQVRETLTARTPQLWREPGHQQAWRTAETLVGDLDVYHSESAPTDLTGAEPTDRVRERCAISFGPVWTQVEASYQARVPAEVREQRDYLALAAMARWGDQPEIEGLDG